MTAPPAGTTGAVIEVEDLDDPRLAGYRDLNDPAARRRLEAELGIIVVEGRVAVRQLLDSGLAVRSPRWSTTTR